VVALGAGGAAGGAVAGEPRLQPAFRVTALADGRTADTAELSRPDRWVLVYVVPDCRPCDHLVRAFKRWRTPALTERTVLLIGAVADDATAWGRETLPRELESIRRYADAEGEAWEALDLEGAPVVLGVQRGRVQWRLSGVLADPAALASILKSWVGE
jgi:hypothetical protein